MYRKPLKDPFSKLLRSQVPLTIAIRLPGPQNLIPLRRPILLPRYEKLYHHQE